MRVVFDCASFLWNSLLAGKDGENGRIAGASRAKVRLDLTGVGLIVKDRGSGKPRALLDRVSIGYELWRQANGFPPTIALDATPSPSATPGGMQTGPAEHRPVSMITDKALARW